MECVSADVGTRKDEEEEDMDGFEDKGCQSQRSISRQRIHDPRRKRGRVINTYWLVLRAEFLMSSSCLSVMEKLCKNYPRPRIKVQSYSHPQTAEYERMSVCVSLGASSAAVGPTHHQKSTARKIRPPVSRLPKTTQTFPSSQ